MKFVHIADLHLDALFALNGMNSEKRRQDQLKILENVAKYVNENHIPYLFIAGDFYEHEYIRESTIKKFKEILASMKNTKVIITPGNHDPYIEGSVYDRETFPENVKVVKGFEVIEDDDVAIFCYGFTDFYDDGLDLSLIQKVPYKKNILVTHGDLKESSFEKEEDMYNPLDRRKLDALNLDYVALGHIHSSNFIKSSTNNIIYPGALVNSSFKERKHGNGMIEGTFQDNYAYANSNYGNLSNVGQKLVLDLIPMDQTEYVKFNLDCSCLNTNEELISTIASLNVPSQNYYKIILVGDLNFPFKEDYVNRRLDKDNILGFEDLRVLKVDIQNEMSKNTLKGNFLKQALEKLELKKKELEEGSITVQQYEDFEQTVKKAIELVLEELK